VLYSAAHGLVRFLPPKERVEIENLGYCEVLSARGLREPQSLDLREFGENHAFCANFVANRAFDGPIGGFAPGDIVPIPCLT